MVRATSATDSHEEFRLFVATFASSGKKRLGEFVGGNDLKSGPSFLVGNAILLAPKLVVAVSFCSQQ